MATREDVIEGLRAERVRAQEVVDACTLALRAFGAEGGPAAPPPMPAPAVRPRRGAPPKARKARKAVSAPGSLSDDAPKTAIYGAAILKALGHHSKAPHQSADSAVLRREVGEACGGRNWQKDDAFKSSFYNALRALRDAKKIERTGDVWALTEKPDA